MQSHFASTRSSNTPLWTIAVTCMMAICAGTASRPSVAAAPAPSAQSRDLDQFDRQFQHAEALYLSGRLKEAATAFEELSRAYPTDARVWLKYGNTLTKLGSYENAAAAFQTAAGLDPAHGNASLNLALVRLAQAQGALDAALAHLASDSPEHAQAEALQRQINTLLGGPVGGASPH
jgi:tetratricopeptide (TPR) repeat protein